MIVKTELGFKTTNNTDNNINLERNWQSFILLLRKICVYRINKNVQFVLLKRFIINSKMYKNQQV
jgi:hypothetical protein